VYIHQKPRGGESLLAVEDGAFSATNQAMKTNTSIKQPERLKPLHPRLTPEDRLESDLRLLHRALCLWERKNQRVAAGIQGALS